MAAPLPKVTWSFSSQGDPSGQWRVARMHCREALSESYTATLDLANQDLAADPDLLLGRGCELITRRDAHAVRLCGVVHRVEHRGTTAGHLLARAHVVPALHALAQRTNSLIFQEKTVPEILAAVLNAGLTPFNRSHRLDLQRTYPKREYCVQYRETDLEFVERLMAEEGIAYRFDHAGSEELMVLFDANTPLPAFVTMDGGAVEIQGPEHGTAETEVVRHFDLVNRMQSTSSVVRDFDWTQPALDLTRESRGTDSQGMDREVYEYPPPLTIGDYANPRYTAEDGAVQSRLRRELYKSNERRFSGLGYVTGFSPGQVFTLTGHGDALFDGDHALVRVEHFGQAPEELTNATTSSPTADSERYHNTFECVEKDVPFRPARAYVRPKIYGIQTAKVVGPAGEEIYTDEHGRIKVQFHWDRIGANDEKSSCWIRVSQSWAGPGWGFVFLPRIGMEVVVQFLEGDPDRPLVTGCVYNGQNTPPYPLPADKTKSTIKSNSSPGGNGSNEIRFEDAAGSEEVYIHAQKDMNEVVEHDHTTRVKNNHTNTVDVNDTESVGGDQSLTVSGNRTKTVKKDEKTTINQNRVEVVDIDETITVHGNRTETVDGNETITVHGNQTVTVDGDRSATVHGSEGTAVDGDQTQTVGGNRTAAVVGNQNVEVGGNANEAIDGNHGVTVGGNEDVLVSGNQSVQVDGNQNVHVSGNLGARADGNAQVEAGSNLSLVAGSTATLQGATVHVTASGELVLSGGGSSIKISGAGVEINGATVKVAGGSVDITGALVKIN
jgi:type VI secretion system secreted protein VgrG